MIDLTTHCIMPSLLLTIKNTYILKTESRVQSPECRVQSPESSPAFILCHVAQLDRNSRLYPESRGFENVGVPLLFISPLTQTYFRMSLVSAPSRLKGKTRAEKEPR